MASNHAAKAIANYYAYYLTFPCLQVTSLVVGFVCKLHTSFSNTVFLKQLVQIGFLAQFESLLSTNGRESESSFFFLNCFPIARSFPKISMPGLATTKNTSTLILIYLFCFVFR